MIELVVIALIFYGLGLVLASNFRTAASVLGLYFIGRQRLKFIHWEHRRERIWRGIGCFLCLLVVLVVVNRLAYTRSDGSIADNPLWVSLAELPLGLGPPIILWWLTRATHGPEKADNEPSEKFF